MEMGKGMDGMTVENITWPQLILNNEQNVHTKVSADRSAIPSDDHNRIGAAVRGSNALNRTVDKENITEAMEKMNDFLSPTRRNLKFELHDKLERYYVSVVDSDTDEVIKEIPPKKFLDMYAAMAEYMGILVDKKI